MTLSPLARLAPAALLVLAAGTAAAAPEEWTIDSAHSSVQFAVKHLMVSTVRGSFDSVKGTIRVDEAAPAQSSVQVSIDPASIDTGNAKRDEHLRSADFFDVEKHPEVTFTSTSVAPAAGGGWTVTGDLAMHGVTKPVTLAVEPLTAAITDPRGRKIRGASATATIDRREWGLTWNKALEAGGVAVSDEVKLQLDLELTQAAPAPAAPAAAAQPLAPPATPATK